MEVRKLLNIARKHIGMIGIIAIVVILRLLPHPPNVAPIGGLALFSGAHLSKKSAIIISLLVMFISDLFLGFHNTMPFVYGSFIAIVFIGSLLRKNQKPIFILKASLAASFLFFIVTNFGVWLVGNMYPKTLSGLVNAYILALPFFRNTIIGDFVYTFSFFYGYRLIENIAYKPDFVIRKQKG